MSDYKALISKLWKRALFIESRISSISKETSVIITDWPCKLKKSYNEEDFGKYEKMWKTKDIVLEDKCTGCKACLRSGCSSLIFDPETKKTRINSNTCVGCDVCLQICPFDAIVKDENYG